MSASIETMSNEAAAEYLRLALPLMTRHCVPATPKNYTVWYTYVSGESPELSAEIDKLVADGKTFTPEINARIYRQFIEGRDVEIIENVRCGLSKLLGEIGRSLNEAGNDAHAFHDVLGNFANETSDGSNIGGMNELLSTLIEETRSMRAATGRLQNNFETKNKEIEELHEQLKAERQRAVTDPLTGLMNRAGLMDEMEAAVEESAEHGSPLCIVMLDIDHFKAINDTHGHLIGDRVIRFVAQVMQKNTKGKDIAARYGGEEFTVLLPDTPINGAQTVAEKIRASVAQAQLVRADNKKPLGQITLSAGVASYQPGEDIMDFIDRADQALYRSKTEGRNRVSAG